MCVLFNTLPQFSSCFIYLFIYIFFPLCRTDDAEVIFSDAETLGLMVEDFAWIVSERAFAAVGTPVGELAGLLPWSYSFVFSLSG